VRSRPAATFVARFVAVYAILMAAWPGLSAGYGSIYRAAADLLFGSRGPTHSVRIARVDPGRSRDATWQRDTVIVLEIAGESVGHRPIPAFATERSRYTGYVPTAIAVALVAATAVPWRRRALASLLAIALMSAFAALAVAAWIHGWFLLQESLYRAEASPRWSLVSRSALALLEIDGSMGPYYVAPVLVWLLLAVRGLPGAPAHARPRSARKASTIAPSPGSEASAKP
jgi:hypothetical protein